MTEIRDAVDAAIAGTLTDAGWAQLLREGIASGQELDFMPRARDYRVISRLIRLGHVPAVSVAAPVVREALLNHAAHDPNGLLVRGLRIVGELDLDFATLGFPVRMTGVRIEGDLGMTSLRAGDVEFAGSWMRNVRLSHARVENDLSLVDSVVDGSIDATVASFGALNLGGVRVSSLENAAKALVIELADVAGDLQLGDADIRGAVSAIGVDVRGSFLLDDARLGMPVPVTRGRGRRPSAAPRPRRPRNPAECMLCLDSARIGGVLDLSGVVSGASILARGVTVGGQAKFSRLQIRSFGAAPSVLSLDGTTVVHDVFLDRIVAPQVSMTGGSIGSDLSLREARLTHVDSVSARFDETTVGEWLILDGSTMAARFQLRGAAVGAQLSAVPSGAHVTRIEQIDLSRSTIGGDVTLAAEIPQGLIANRTDMRSVFHLNRAVRIGPPAAAASPAGAVVIARNATIHRLQLGLDIPLDGPLDLSGARIDVLDVGELTDENTPVGAHADGAGEADPATRLPSIRPTGTIEIGSVSGFLNDGWRHAAAWLDGRPAPKPAPESRRTDDARAQRRGRTFGIQPWMALAAVFENSGRESEARRLKFEATDRLFRHRSNWFSSAVWRRITKITIGHGYYSQLALVWLAGLWLATTILIAVNPAAFSPTDREAAMEQPTAVSTVVPDPVPPDESVATLTTGSSDPAPTAYPAFSAPLYAVDVVVSPVGTGQSAAWWVSGDLWLSALITLIKLTAWSLLGLFVTGVSGILSKR
ncbi:hypothetical protein [Leifsonia sp. NPDC080035]|uniref:Membrane-associated oxidoreductase n=1 Tax=Leifsonia sp. NPDC080035 TaxID=3143936 RepID=A0AAU7GC93_9MICO